MKEKLVIPDPGVYNPNDSFTKVKNASFSFGTDKRPTLENKSATKLPGPGAYDVSSAGKNKTGFHIGIKYKE